jgi:hypothetical protein
MSAFRFCITNFFFATLVFYCLHAEEEIVPQVVEEVVELDNQETEVLGDTEPLLEIESDVVLEVVPEIVQIEEPPEEPVKEPVKEPVEEPVEERVEEPVEETEVRQEPEIVESTSEVIEPQIISKNANDQVFVTIEGRVSYFWPESKLFRDIYHKGGISYALTGIVPVYRGDLFALRGLNFWWSADYFYRSGTSKTLDTSTKIQMEMITAGLKYMYPAYFIRPYIGLGCKYYFVQVHTHSSYMKHHVNRNGAGMIAEIGFQTLLAKYLTLDLFCAYSYKEFGSKSVHLENVKPTYFDVSGINAGAGLGLKF